MINDRLSEIRPNIDSLEKLCNLSIDCCTAYSTADDIISDYDFLSELVTRNTKNKRLQFFVSAGSNSSEGTFLKLVHPNTFRYIVEDRELLVISLHVLNITKRLFDLWNNKEINALQFAEDLDKCYKYLFDVSFTENAHIFISSHYGCDLFYSEINKQSE